MAGLNAWLLAALGLLPPLALSAFVALRGDPTRRLVATQFCTSNTLFMLVLLTVALDQPSFLDLGLTLVLVNYPGTLIYSHFLERWL
ncbi:Multiple resistance and pH regulation protein F (MrpF / PhaF) [Faunimonas pinastri]|uniref:Multiple resistance and pH regulation protein F (MrpF / PhaF) n=1 Tax=Faunimonas pinastri TaxID=1855383 RepID=A0A1H9LFZ4_9HYPH|nr:MrpF/PhaF family protein [Faunimonas pinastri]SER10411.1 Multiple resistance and pH regulation protein F (MrpF / PhaF) [Faunimonas pinastri]